MRRVLELQTGTSHASEKTFEQRADGMNELFSERLVPFMREIYSSIIENQVQEQLYYQQTLEYQNRGAKADIIRQKYEQISREYNAQNKQFAERHFDIKNDEQAKREQILKNFDEHLGTIRFQMAEDVEKSKEENELLKKETADLEAKFEDLKKECVEKMEMMTQ